MKLHRAAIDDGDGDRAINGAIDHAVHRAIHRAATFLLSAQSADGSFVDWNLPPGPSTGWTTAYIGAALAAVPSEQRERTAPAARRAAEWLVAHEASGGGWSYNGEVACDADSTAHAILLLAAVGLPIAARSRDRLRAYQRRDGGFSTYGDTEGFGSWGASHADVSAVCGRAMLAMGELPASPAVRRCLAFTAAQRAASGLWPSFWWRSPLYATQANLAWLIAAGAPLDRRLAERGLAAELPNTAFERALWLDAWLRVAAASAPNTTLVLRALLADQQADGGWPSAPMLRVTRRDCTEPWADADAGALYADPKRLFTTATVLRALSVAVAVAVSASLAQAAHRPTARPPSRGSC